MKRSAYPFLLAAIVAIGLSLYVAQDVSLDGETFASQFRDTVRRTGFAVLSEAAASTEEVPIPFTVKWHPRRWRAALAAPGTAEFPDSAVRYTLARGGASKVECFVRYLDGRVHLIDIRADRREPLEAADLRVALKQQFPRFPVKLQAL